MNSSPNLTENVAGSTYVIFMLGIAASFTLNPLGLSYQILEPATLTILRCGIGAIAMLPFALREYETWLDKQKVLSYVYLQDYFRH